MAESFRKMYNKFRAALQEGWQTGEVAAHFGPTASLESMFQYLASLPEAQQFLIPPNGDQNIVRKGAVESERFRNVGNRFYTERKLEKALLAYNYSILAAPHPPMVNNSFTGTGKEFEVLALGYANRSALLYETGQYEYAMADIERAVAFGYPTNKLHRILERQAKCHIALGHSQEAQKTLEEAINQLTTLSLEEKEASAIKESMTKLLTKCDGNNPPAENSDYERLYYTGPTAAPIVNSPQENMPCMSDALKIAYTPTRGRHLVAVRDIQPGEVLIVEDALSAIVKLNATLRTHCTNCLRRAPIPIPCPTCSLVVFCSDSCRSTSLDGAHASECKELPALVALQLDPAPLLALHTLTCMTLPKLRSQINAIRRTTGNIGGGSKPLLQVVKDYKSLYYLEGHMTARSETQLQETAAMAFVLARILLERCPRFLKDKDGSNIMPTERDITMIGGQLMQLILGIECNVHSTKETEVSCEKNCTAAVRKSRGTEVGWSVYSGLSLINHSCIPNSLTTSIGSSKFLYSISIIPKGGEITDSYGERYVTHGRAERRKALQDHYFFLCGCSACHSDWPVYEELDEKPSLRCPSCCQLLVGFQCLICKIACTSETALKNGIRLYDAPKTQIQISRTWAEYSKAADQIHNGKINAQLLAKVLEMLTLLDKYTVHPNKAYILCQETLMTCFDLMGSIVYKNSSSKA